MQSITSGSGISNISKGGKIADNCRLTRKQEHAILELLNPINRTLKEVAKKVGVSERTLRYWMKLPQFQKGLQEEKTELHKQGLDNLRTNFNLATMTLGTLLTDKSPVIRLKACQTILDYNFKLMERDKEKKPQHPYDDYYEYDANPDSPSQVVSIYERLNRLKILTKSHLEKMNEELDRKEKEKGGGDEIKLKDP